MSLRYLTLALLVSHTHLASGGFEDVVRELLGAGAEVNRTNDKGLTPLYASP